MTSREHFEEILSIKLPDEYELYSPEIQMQIIKYLSTFNIIEKKAYMIAKQHLGMSFNLIKSNGYIDWIKNN